MTVKQKYSILLTLGGLSALTPLSIDTYLPAFPKIAEDLNTDIPHISFSLTAYLIGVGIGQIIYGPATDKFGRRKPLFIGLLIFFIASLCCTFSSSINELIFSRTILALGACAGMVTSTASVKDLFESSEIAGVFSILMLILGLGPIIGPVLGSGILTIANWKFIFYFLAFFSLILIIVTYLYLPETNTTGTKGKFTLNNILADYHFVVQNQKFVLLSATVGTAMAGMFAYIGSSPFVFISFFKFNELQYSVAFAFNAIGFILGSQINKRLLKVYSPLTLIYASVGLSFIAALTLLSLVLLNLLSPVMMIVIIFVYLFCLGFIIPNSTATALSDFKQHAGTASAFLGFLQMILSALCSWMVGYFSDGSLIPIALGIFCPSLIYSCCVVLMSKKNEF